jgi:hypothetical protein
LEQERVEFPPSRLTVTLCQLRYAPKYFLIFQKSSLCLDFRELPSDFLISETTQQSRGISNVNPRLSNVLGNNGPGSDDCAITDRDREYCGVRPDTYTVADLRSPPEIAVSSSGAAVNKEIVDKHGPMRNEAVVPNHDELADKRMGLNPAPFADIYSLLYLYKRPDKGPITNSAPIEIDWLHHRDVFTERYIDNPYVPNFWLCHKDVA